MVERERRDSQRNQKHNSVFIQRVALPENSQMKKHDRKEFAGLCQNEGQVVDMRQAGVAKGRGQRRCNADEEQREEYLARRKDWGHFLACWSGEEEVEETGEGSEGRLDGVQDN